MRFAAYTHQDRDRLAVVGDAGVLYPVPGAGSLTEVLAAGRGLPALLALGTAALQGPPGPLSPGCACGHRCGPPPYGTS